MRVWDDNEAPLGYLITFRTYGTWLHGDARSSIDRTTNIYRTPRIPPKPGREAYNQSIMKMPPVLLDGQQRAATLTAIEEVCTHRGWLLRAINVRTNYAHLVVSTGARNSAKVLNAFEAYATRRMRDLGCWSEMRSPWVDKGSERWLWKEISLEAAVWYVRYGQGEDLAEFDRLVEAKNPPADAGGSAL